MEEERKELLELVRATQTLVQDHCRSGFSLKASRKASATNEPQVKSVSLPKDILQCTRCKLHKTRTHVVVGAGNPKADLLFIGEAPGRDEDLQGQPFVGRAGKLLTDIIEAIGLKREEVFICNVIKCRPPENREPEPDEIASCRPFLLTQIQEISPKLITTLGRVAAQALLEIETPISKIRGQFQMFQGIWVMPTYHPAYLLRNPSAKKEVWEDMKQVHAELCRLTGREFVRKGRS